MAKAIVTHKSRVLAILKEYPSTRNNDVELYWKVLEVFFDIRNRLRKRDHYKALMEAVNDPKLPAPATISRAKRIIQAGGKYKAKKKR